MFSILQEHAHQMDVIVNGSKADLGENINGENIQFIIIN